MKAYLILVAAKINDSQLQLSSLSHPEQISVKIKSEFYVGCAVHTHDRDDDNLSFMWFNYPEAGTYIALAAP